MTDLDLTACDREPIHIPGAIQPHGALLVLDRLDQRIEQAGGSCERYLGAFSAAVIGRRFSELVGGKSADLTFEACSEDPLYVGAVVGADGTEIDVVAHIIDENLVVELEAAPGKRRSGAELARTVEAVSGRFGAANGLPELFEVAVGQFRAVTGFDRVMIYQFLPDSTGSVVAEAKVEGLPTFLNHRFPASDIRRRRARFICATSSGSYLTQPTRRPISSRRIWDARRWT